jgi:hypothetical protein
MSKVQTDIRTTSYDANSVRPDGYQGDIDEVLEQIRLEPDTQHQGPRGRAELLMFLNVDRVKDVERDLSIDKDPRYGFEDGPVIKSSNHYVLESEALGPSLLARIMMLSPSQQAIYRMSRESLFSVTYSLRRAEAYPYPVPRE